MVQSRVSIVSLGMAKANLHTALTALERAQGATASVAAQTELRAAHVNAGRALKIVNERIERVERGR